MSRWIKSRTKLLREKGSQIFSRAFSFFEETSGWSHDLWRLTLTFSCFATATVFFLLIPNVSQQCQEGPRHMFTCDFYFFIFLGGHLFASYLCWNFSIKVSYFKIPNLNKKCFFFLKLVCELFHSIIVTRVTKITGDSAWAQKCRDSLQLYAHMTIIPTWFWITKENN